MFGAQVPAIWHVTAPALDVSQAWHSADPHTGVMYDGTFQRNIRRTATAAGIGKPASLHMLRYAFATYLLQTGYCIRTVQDLLGHVDVATTIIHAHLLNVDGGGVKCLLDSLTLRPAKLTPLSGSPWRPA